MDAHRRLAPQSFVDRERRLVARLRPLALEVGPQLRERVLERFNWQTIAAETVALYERLLYKERYTSERGFKRLIENRHGSHTRGSPSLGRKAGGREARARAAFDAMGCVAWAEQARSELRASGEASRRRDPSARDQLTAQELQIAQLASQGLSNREIGQRLYLSHRTVGTHLYRVFPKLGISTRGELVGALASGPSVA